MKNTNIINYLKGYSIFTIVLMHLITEFLSVPGILKKAAAIGGSGVHIFIICSGFGLFYSYLNRPIKFYDFIKKRFSKIYKPYILIVIISSIFSFMYVYSDRVIAVLSHIFLFKMFVERYEGSFGIQFWFISTIIQLYLLFYILIKVKNKINNNKIFLLLSLVVSIIWWIVVALLGKEDMRIWNSFALQYLWEFSFGIVWADIYYKKKEMIIPKRSILILCAVLGLSITAITGLKGGAYKVFNDIPSMIGYGGLALLIYSIDIKFLNNIFIKLSKISYEWYLTHMLIFSLIFNINIEINKYIIGILAFIFSLLGANIYNKMLSKNLVLCSKKAKKINS